MRSITYTNATNNFSLTFGEEEFQPFILASVDGLYSVKNNVQMSDNTMTDGSTYQGSIAVKRNIVLRIMDNPQSEDFVYDQYNRDILYTLFRKGEFGTLIYTENGVSRKIECQTESITRALKGSRIFTISLLCPNPMFTDVDDKRVAMANWISNFQFPHNFVEEGEEIDYKSDVRSVNIVNDIAADNTGLTIEIVASGTVSNITISHIELDEHISVGSTGKSFTMVLGDKLIITTGLNNKHVRLVHNGVTSEMNQYVTEDSEFIQLIYGNNNITYSATTGEEYMSVNISYNFQYEGA